jgi:hypothetical protein
MYDKSKGVNSASELLVSERVATRPAVKLLIKQSLSGTPEPPAELLAHVARLDRVCRAGRNAPIRLKSLLLFRLRFRRRASGSSEVDEKRRRKRAP